MIKNIIFDCADTLLHFYYVDCLAERTKKDKRQIANVLRSFMGTQAWGDFDNGKLTEKEVADALLPTLAKEDREIAQTFLSEFTDYFFMIDGTPALLAQLKQKGYQLFLLSDFPAKFASLRQRFDIFDLFDKLVVSYQYGVSKRDHGLFARLLEECHLDPNECMFFDDIAANVEAAASFGIHGVVYTGVDSVRNALGL